ncbi:MAG: transcriptional regulator [Rhodobacteraceae bacterium]|nr:ChrR family anti-sigma-E factor [Alphaproteobacteria bacterium]NNK66727.1 transcriptional regulator [Paracoccaceae bacterium]
MMTTIKHHLTDDILMGYSAGTLPEAFDLVVATHVSLCDECRARMDSFDAVGGVVLEDCAETAMSEDSLAATMALIENGDSVAQAPRVASKGSVFPSPLQEYVNGDLDAVKWRGLGGGVKQAVLKTSKDASVRLLRIPAGAKMPDHGHRGTEMTLVLKGAFRDEDDRFARGDVEIADEHLHHTPIAEEGEDCICLAATDAPLKFNAFIPRIAQPFLGI